jgi:hypothetical protein
MGACGHAFVGALARSVVDLSYAPGYVLSLPA